MQNRFIHNKNFLKKNDLGPIYGFQWRLMVKIILGAIINMVV